MQLHKCLRKLLIEVVAQRDGKIQLVYLKEVFIWFMTKLQEVSLITQQELDKEFEGLNSVHKTLSSHMRQIVSHKVKSSLINEEERMNNYKAMFVNAHEDGVAPRTAHPGIPSASIRIKNFATRSLKGLDEAVGKIK